MLTVPLVLILLVFVFFILRILPGDLALALVGNRVTDAQLALVRHQYGLDLPLYRQFFNYFWDVLHGNLGIVITGDRTVLETILIALPNTLEIAFSGVFLGALIGIGMGVFVGKTKRFSKLGSFVVQFILSLPVFWAAILLQMFLGVTYRVFPVTGLIGSNIPVRLTGVYVLDSLVTGNVAAFVDSLRHLILPALSIAIYYMAPVALMTSASFKKASQEDYTLTQRAAGLPMRIIDYKYTMKNALLPVIALIGVQFAGLVSGAVLVESVFSIPGLGWLLVTAITERDFTLIQGTLIFIGVLVALTSIVIDILISAVDPRVKY